MSNIKKDIFKIIAAAFVLLLGYLLIGGGSREGAFGAYLRIVDESAYTTPGALFVVAAVDTEDTYNPNRMYYTSMTSSTWRNSMKDSIGKPVAITWYAHMSTATCDPPPNDDKNCLIEYDTMLKYTNVLNLFRDSLEWHYHHCTRQSYGCTAEWSFNDLNKWKAEHVLNRMLIDRNFFPSSYRAGWEWEDTGLSNFLEGVLFSDYSNNPRSGVWLGAPNEWTWYHPSSTDFKKKGDMSRYINNCVPTSSSNPATTDVIDAFKKAASGEDTIFCWWIHNWDPSWDTKFKSMHNLLVNKSKEYGVKFIYENGREATRRLLNDSDNTPPTFTISPSGNNLVVSSSEELFNANPYGALKLSDSTYKRAQLTKVSSRQWSYDMTSLLGTSFTFAVGGSDTVGNVGTAKFSYAP